MTLPELLVALVILGILGGAVLRLVVSEMRSVDLQIQQRSARAVTRSSMNLLLSELRMVEPNGVIAATPRHVDIDVPYAMGLSCGLSVAGTGRTVVTLLPVDSAQYAGASFDGYAWRDAGGTYTYVDTSVALVASTDSSTCQSARIASIPGSRVVELLPPLPAAAGPGTPVLLHQLLEYRFEHSHDLPGTWALWRTVLNRHINEEIASPFDSSAAFQFYRVGADTAEALPPASLGDLRGLGLNLTGLSVRPRLGGKAPERASQQSVVFFGNATP